MTTTSTPRADLSSLAERIAGYWIADGPFGVEEAMDLIADGFEGVKQGVECGCDDEFVGELEGIANALGINYYDARDQLDTETAEIMVARARAVISAAQAT